MRLRSDLFGSVAPRLAFGFTAFFFFEDPATPDIYTLSLHDALPISVRVDRDVFGGELVALADVDLVNAVRQAAFLQHRSEEHTSELQSHSDLVCRLLLEKKNTFAAHLDDRDFITAETSRKIAPAGAA